MKYLMILCWWFKDQRFSFTWWRLHIQKTKNCILPPWKITNNLSIIFLLIDKLINQLIIAALLSTKWSFSEESSEEKVSHLHNQWEKKVSTPHESIKTRTVKWSEQWRCTECRQKENSTVTPSFTTLPERSSLMLQPASKPLSFIF